MDPKETFPLPDVLSGPTAEDSVLPEDAQAKAFQEERRTSIGATDMAAILGYSPWRTAWDVAAEKRGLLPDVEPTERMRWGTLMEEPIAKEYARRTGRTLATVGTIVRDPKYPFIGGHPDRLVVRPDLKGYEKGAEIKTADTWHMKEWSDPGQPLRVPKHYFIQTQGYLGLYPDLRAWDLVPLFGLKTMRIYEIARNDLIIEKMWAKAREFWEQYVVGPDLPPIEPSERAKAWLKMTYPKETTKDFVLANPEQEEVISKWLEARKVASKAEKEMERWKLQVQTIIGSASGVRAGDDVITWKKDRDSVTVMTDYEAVCLEMAVRHNLQVPADLIVKHTHQVTTREGARKLLVRGPREK